MTNSMQLEIVKEIRCNVHNMLCDEKAVVCWIEVILNQLSKVNMIVVSGIDVRSSCSCSF